MRKAIRSLVVPSLLIAAILSNGTSGYAASQEHTTPKVMQGLSLTAEARGTVPVVIVAMPGQSGAVSQAVSRLGGKVVRQHPGADFLVARLPAGALPELERSEAVRSVGLDRVVQLDPNAMRPLEDRLSTGVPSSQDPPLSLRITRGEIRAPQFTEQTGADGRGTVIAVLDTGVDPAHPALKSTAGGQIKVVDWQDFTGEGDVALTEKQSQVLPGIPSQSGTYKLGTFKESQIPAGEMGSDINRNGRRDDAFRVLVTDPAAPGLYDTAYVDTNANGSFTDEKPLRAYNQSGDVGLFGSTHQVEGQQMGVSFVVTRIDPRGESLNLGYDGGQHGTHVAGIAAASGPVTGVAPGAQVMAIKVLTSGGSGSWSSIAQGILYAASHGADVINLSLGGLSELNDGSDPLSLMIDDLAARTGISFVIAAGNSGPGAGTLGMPGVAGAAITVGAYISPNTWQADYGLKVPQEGLWYFSSAGPRDDGGLKPNVVAPGTANAPIPTWAGQYAVFQGTSMAAPQTAGAAALLLSAARYQGLAVGYRQVRSAMEQSARRLPGYGWFEQGYGLIQVDGAWEKLRAMAREGEIPALFSLGQATYGTAATGIYARAFQLTPGGLPWVLGNRQPRPLQIDLSYRPGDGLSIYGPRQIMLPPLKMRPVPLVASHPVTPGIYDALAEGRVQGQSAPAVQYLSTLIVPHTFDLAKGHMVNGITGSLGPARYARHFVRVPEGTAELSIQLSVPEKKGRVRVMLYNPDGMPVGTGSGWAGAPQGPEKQSLTVPNPQPGVWEIDAYASHGGLLWGLAENQYVIDVAARGVYAVPSRMTISPAAGQKLRQNVTFVNSYGEITAELLGAGFVQPQTQRVTVENGSAVVQMVEVAESTAILRIDLAGAAGTTDQISLGLYYRDPAAGGWVKVGRRTDQRGVQGWEVLNPAPGTYAVEILGHRVTAGKADLTLSKTLVTAGGTAIQPAGSAARRPFGATWTAEVDLQLPATSGRYTGALILRDAESGKTLTVVPVDVP